MMILKIVVNYTDDDTVDNDNGDHDKKNNEKLFKSLLC